MRFNKHFFTNFLLSLAAIGLLTFSGCEDPIVVPVPNEPVDQDFFSQTITVDGGILIDRVLEVSGDVTIAPGTVLFFEEGAGLDVTGSLKAVGTADEPITFRGVTEVKGFWTGLHIDSNSPNNDFNYVRVRHAGSGTVQCCSNTIASIHVESGRLSLRNSELSDGEGVGLSVEDDGLLSEYDNNTITTHDLSPIVISANHLGELDGTSSSYTNNGNNVAVISDEDVRTSQTWPNLGIAYLFPEGTIEVIDCDIDIEAGATLTFEENGGLAINEDASLKAVGTSDNTIVFNGLQDVPGYWAGLHYESNNNDNQLEYIAISNAGSGALLCCSNSIASVFMEAGILSIKNSVIDNGNGYGLAAEDDSEIVGFENNTISNHKENPIFISPNNIGNLDGTGSTYTGNDDNTILIDNVDCNKNQTWAKANIPYKFTDIIEIEAVVTVERGSVFEFDEDAGIAVTEGSFKLTGTSSEKIILRGAEDVTGYWAGLHYETTSNNNQLNHVNIANGGSQTLLCCSNIPANVFVESGLLSITNCSITKSGGCGIAYESDATVSISGNSYSGNTDGNECN